MQSGYIISERGHAIAAGVVCKCPNYFCPAHGELRMKYTVTDSNGNQIARYENASELRTFVKASYPHVDSDQLPVDRVGQVEVKDANNDKTLATINVVQ